jgi:kumamolisin
MLSHDTPVLYLPYSRRFHSQSSILLPIKVVNSISTINAKLASNSSGQSSSNESTAGFSVPEIARLYDFPAGNGSGQTIALIELGGGYKEDDLKPYFARLNLPEPEVVRISVDGASYSPTTNAQGADQEVTMDIEVAGAVAPNAQILVFFTPNTNQGFQDAVSAAIHWNDSRKPSVISISWGGPEGSWTSQSMQTMNQVLAQAANLGITVVCAAGDSGVTDGVKDGRRHVDFPASSPNVLAIGGTKIIVEGNTITSESAWNDGEGGATGGGISDIFALPSWQNHTKLPSGNDGHLGRGIPDVSVDASLGSGCRVYIGGREKVLGGTAASTPLWAGLIALMNQQLGHNIGYFNPLLYTKIGPADVLRNITVGDNSVHDVKGYSAGLGWNSATGWGSPDGKKLLEALKQEK